MDEKELEKILEQHKLWVEAKNDNKSYLALKKIICNKGGSLI